MSVRGTKRTTAVRGDEPSTSKRRRAEPEDQLWQLRPVSDLKMSSIYNRSASEAPAELFRKDLISAMKLPDSEPLTPNEYWVITDTWKQDWERGVQVPVNPDSLPAPNFRVIDNPLPPNFQEFKLPKDKYIHLNRDAHYQPDKHHLSNIASRAEASCTYDLDAMDTAWLKLLNSERARAGVAPVSEDKFEKVIEELEVRCWDKIQAIMKSEEGLGIEYDENVICDVCRSPDSEEGNEMVFCDSCNICVHQACYGITTIPSGQWLCRPCGDKVEPTCVLCPNLGGAMKCTPSGHKWAHVSCVLWIPEVSIGCPEKMEPITKISAIPASRWSLVCVLCRERKGACIQCSVKTCKTAYHVTCAFKHGLEMRAIIEDENADDGVKLRSYCQKHSVNSKKEKSGSGSEDEEIKRKRRKDMTSEEKSQARAARLQEIESEFDRHVSIKDISTHVLDVDQDAIFYIYNYWKLKRRAGHNRPLLPPKSDDADLLSHRQEQADLDKMKMFVQLRQDLERVRNLCYMVSRREKLSRSFFRMREQTFHKQLSLLSSGVELPGPSRQAIIEANHGPSIYDRLYSHPDADHKTDFEVLLSKIAGVESSDEKKKDLNGLIKSSKNTSNPYKKVYVNGSRRSGSMYSGFSSDDSTPEARPSTSKYRHRPALGSSTEDDNKPSVSTQKKKVSPNKEKKNVKKTDRKKRVPPSRTIIESSTEEDIKTTTKKDKSRSKTLRQLEKEMGAQSGTESDDLMPIRSTRNNKFPVDIYSDSSENSSPNKTDNFNMNKSPNDSQQQLPRTKAAMKQFVPITKSCKDATGEKRKGRKPSTFKDKANEFDEDAKNKENIKFSKSKDYPSDLIVPQRQAAKKASENMRSTTTTTTTKIKDSIEQSGDKHTSAAEETKTKSKGKSKSKDKEPSAKEINKKKRDSYELDKDVPETIAYVPQRQAAKKAAAHIKSGLGNKVPVVDATEDKRKDSEKSDTTKKSPKKDDEKRAKSPPKSSSSSSSNSSSSSYSSSSSSEEEVEKSEAKPSVKAREIKPIRQPSLFSPQPTSRPTVDLPFLDKVSRPLSSTSASSDSDSSKGSQVSGSRSPTPKRARPRRKERISMADMSPRKPPEKKLKTSERRPEYGVSSPTAEGEESTRSNAPRSTTRSRARSIPSSGNISNKSDARQRKQSKDEPSNTIDKPAKETTGKPSELSVAERKTDETLNKNNIQSPDLEKPKSDEKAIPEKSQKRLSDEKQKDESKIKHIPQKNVDTKHKTLINRRTSVKDTSKDDSSKQRKVDSFDVHSKTESSNKKSSPTKSSSTDKTTREKKLTPSKASDDITDHDKDWFPKAPSPHIQPPPVEKLGDNEKYMTEDKSLDSDCTDKSGIKMIAKIQANLNENTMIKSPKTPMDARTIDPIEVDIAVSRSVKKRSGKDTGKKSTTQDASHVQGVEISKSAKIPSTVTAFPNRSIFSPQPKDNELFELDMLAVDEGFNNDEMIKPFTSYPELFLKEDSKEDRGVQETLNLVEKLRMTLSTKKPPTSENAEQEDLAIPCEDKEEQQEAMDAPKAINNETDVHSKHRTASLDYIGKKSSETQSATVVNHMSHNLPESSHLADAAMDVTETIGSRNNDKWSDLSMVSSESHVNIARESRYLSKEYTDNDNVRYTDVPMKDTINLQSDIQSTSELDRDTMSKQSDDSQSLSVADHEPLSHINENNNSLIHSDSATISSPYIDSQDAKWRESKITQRRSSASSTNSDDSMCSQKTNLKIHMNSSDSHRVNIMPEIDAYPPLPQYALPIEAMPLNQYSSYSGEPSSFMNAMTSVSLFPSGVCGSSQLTMPSPGGPLYPPNIVPYSSTSLIAPLPKPSFSTLCAAAFTTSSQNIALTTAMIAPPTPKPIDSPHEDIDIGSDKYSVNPTPSPTISVDSYNDLSTNRSSLAKVSNESGDSLTVASLPEPKSPVKPSKTTTKFVTQSKSPGKSPGISPKQSEVPKSSTKRSANKNNRGQRGRGRSKSRAHGIHGYPTGNVDYLGNSIQSKLVGTVYDFDEEIANDSVDLKALRERRKSIDIHDRKSENSYKDSSQSPHIPSPNQNSNKKASASDVKDAKPASPVHEARESGTPPSTKKSSDRTQTFPAVQPVLPGPVDMRTYQQFEGTAAAAAAGEAYHSHLLAFASGTADQQLPDIDEEIEKQLHSALKASKQEKSPTKSAVVTATETSTTQKYTPEVTLPKVSLSDSRNQLKVKIKGPFLDANYSTSSVQPVVPQPPIPVLEPSTNILGAPNSVASSAMMTGTTNLRRMRKKELLRQYWTQDMNMDDPTNTSALGSTPAPTLPPPITRAVITIPKAVASMTSIPTREDYKGVSDTNVEKKKRKNTSGVSRELRHLEVSMNDDVDEMRLSSYSSVSHSFKRRGRITSKPTRPIGASPVTPKLKIKIGSGFVQPVNTDEPFGDQFRPPKKRLAILPKPSLEDLRRESMKYRRMVMADFEEDEKVKKHKPKSEKRKRKRDKKSEKLQVVNSDSDSATKLIIKIKRTKEEGGGVKGEAAARVEDPFEYDPTAPDPLAIDPPSYSEASSAMRKIRTAKVTPIRLKLSRNAEGSSYVMKDAAGKAGGGEPAPDQPMPVAVSKHCEVR